MAAGGVGGAGGAGGAASGAWTAALCATGRGWDGALATAPPKSSATDSAGPTSMILEQTEQRARTPVAGTLSGSIR